MASQIQIRRDSSANWNSINPILAQGEFGLEIDTGKIKCGDGITAWNSLEYFLGANKVQLKDTGNLFTATDVEGALAEVKDDVARHEADYASLLAGGETFEVVLQNGWTGTLEYSKNDMGLIWLRGAVVAGTTTHSTIIGILPSGYRPGAFSHMFEMYVYTHENVGAVPGVYSGNIISGTSGSIEIRFNSSDNIITGAPIRIDTLFQGRVS